MMINLARRYVQFLSERSIIDRFLGGVRIGRSFPFRDRVDVLEHDALGMFFYNQRALFFGGSGVFLAAVVAAVVLTAAHSTAVMALALLILTWIIGVSVTLILHNRFVEQLQTWAKARAPLQLPPLFDVYFLFDCSLLIALVLTGKALSLRLDAVGYVLAANVIVYAAYVFGGHASKLAKGGVLLAMLVAALLLIPVRHQDYSSDAWFHETLLAACIASMLLITVFSVTLMAALATIEHQVTRRQLELLGRYQDILLGDMDLMAPTERADVPHSQQLYRKRLRALYRDLCAPSAGFWYRSIGTWFLEQHHDRGAILLPGPYEEFSEASRNRDGVDASTGFADVDRVTLLHSLGAQVDSQQHVWRFKLDLDGPAAIVPLRRDKRRLGSLLVYGDEHSPPVPPGDEQFLSTLAAMIVTGLEQWQSRFRAAAHTELDSLFALSALEEVFPKAVRVLQKYLYAAGCMLIFRPDPDQPTMSVVAATGFDRAIFESSYTSGVGQTGRCAATGETIRVDDVDLHREVFDAELLKRLERSHGAPVKSWMSIPIGAEPRNYGVIKVINSTFPATWFTAEDEDLGRDLAVRLQVIIELFLQIRRSKEAKEEALRNADIARDAQGVAEQAARERLQDLITITHQQQAPLIAVIGALTGISPEGLTRGGRDLLEHARALVEDALTVGFGTFTTFGRAAGRETALVETDVDAAKELKSLALRLQRTNARDDIRLVFKEERRFPHLRIDARVFTSVLYSLIHNAMKYSDWHSEVVLECSFERATGEPAVKVKSVGAPIHPTERQLIFERFKRGRSVERGKIYAGVGLGLWVGRELMRAMEGDLTVELSPSLPRLSVFVVHFPASALKEAK